MNKKLKLALFILLIGAIAVSLYSERRGNDITGNDVTTRVEITDIIPSNCSFNIVQGWNYVSFYCISSSAPRDEVLSSINGSYEEIFTYNIFDYSDPWKSYNPNLPNWTVQDLIYMRRTSGYIILMNDPANYIYEGYKRPSTTPLTTGWNLVGYPDLNNKSINDSLDGLQYNMVLTYEDGARLVYRPNSTGNNFSQFEPYKAYWINSTAGQNWIIS